MSYAKVPMFKMQGTWIMYWYSYHNQLLCWGLNIMTRRSFILFNALSSFYLYFSFFNILIEFASNREHHPSSFKNLSPILFTLFCTQIKYCLQFCFQEGCCNTLLQCCSNSTWCLEGVLLRYDSPHIPYWCKKFDCDAIWKMFWIQNHKCQEKVMDCILHTLSTQPNSFSFSIQNKLVRTISGTYTA